MPTALEAGPWLARTTSSVSRTKPEDIRFPRCHPARIQPPSALPARRRSAQGDRRAVGGPRARRPLPDAARRHRLRQDDDDGQRHQAARHARRSCCRTTRRSPRSSTASSRASSRTTRSSTSSRTTTTTSRKRTSPRPTRTSRRTRRSTRTSTGCGCARRRASWSATTSSSSPRCRQSTASAIRCHTASRWSRSRKGQKIERDDILRSLVRIQYSRNDVAFERGTFRVRGDTVEIFPAYEEQGVRVEMWGDEIERISKINVLTGETIAHARARRDLSGEALRHAAADARARGEAHSRRARRSASPSCAQRASCSRRSDSSRARTSTSR